MMIKEMRKTIPTDTLLGDEDHRQEIFQGMMDDEVSKQMAQRDTRGSLSDLMYHQLAGSRGAQIASPAAPDAAAQIKAAQAAALATQMRETETLK
jgi:Rod binding domain-containing protein